MPSTQALSWYNGPALQAWLLLLLAGNSSHKVEDQLLIMSPYLVRILARASLAFSIDIAISIYISWYGLASFLFFKTVNTPDFFASSAMPASTAQALLLSSMTDDCTLLFLWNTYAF